MPVLSSLAVHVTFQFVLFYARRAVSVETNNDEDR